jgi:hypothetical protein
MLQELYSLYRAQDLAAAEEHFDRFARMWETDPLPEFYRVVSDPLRWAPEIFNFHRVGGRWSNGRLDGTNNLLGLLKRMGFGFVNATNFEAHGVRVHQRRQLRSPRASSSSKAPAREPRAVSTCERTRSSARPGRPRPGGALQPLSIDHEAVCEGFDEDSGRRADMSLLCDL